MTAAVTAPESAPRKPRYSENYARFVLGLLALAYALNTIDRTIINTIGQAIKVDLKLSDEQLGLLGGFSFAVLYTFLGIPIARLAERWNRVSIISIAMLLWSGFTACCGFAGSFLQLALIRVGVGFGEAGLTPTAHSLISDYFEPKKRASALGVYAFGLTVGAMIGAAAGGWLAKTYGWRVAFFAIGAPGVIIAIVLKLLIKEPPRGHSEMVQHPLSAEDVAPVALPPFSLAGELRELASVFKSLFLRWPLANMVIGMTLMTFATTGAGQFISPYFIRTFGLDYATVGLIVGLLSGSSSGVGTLVGGFATDWASKRSGIWYALIPAIGVAIGTPMYIFAYSLNDWKLAALLLLVPGVFFYTFLGPIFSVIQSSVEPRRRATATALVFLSLNILGQGSGPPFIGWVIDHLAQFHFTHTGDVGLFSSLSQAFGGAPDGAAQFALACPGGIAPKGASLLAASACKTALALATRQGVVLGFLFCFWGAFHFCLASIGLVKELERARLARPA